MKQTDDRPRPAVRLSNGGKKFSVTIQVPEDVAARWPEWFSTEKLMGEVFKAAAAAGAPSRARLVSRLSMIAVVVLIVELFIGGLALGYFASAWLRRGQVPPPAAAPSVPGGEEAAVTTPSPGPASAPAAEVPTTETPAAQGPAAETPATQPLAPEAARTPRFRVQVGAYRIRANADAAVGKLRDQGYKADVRTYRGLYLVQVGSFTSRAEAMKLAQELKALGYDIVIIP